MALTGPTAEGDSENERKPTATRTSAPIGRDASSPQTATGLLWTRPLAALYRSEDFVEGPLAF